MSGDENSEGFLERWARRKAQALEERTPAEPATEDTLVGKEVARGEETEPFDLTKLPKLEDITAETDVTIFLRKGVPEALRNAVLKRAWALDPVIRDYVNPAMEYAWDWNKPGSMAGFGDLEAGFDAAKAVAGILSGPVDHTLGGDQPVESAPVQEAEGMQADRPLPAALRQSEPRKPSSANNIPAKTEASEGDIKPDPPTRQAAAADPPRSRRRHGGAAPV